MAGQSDNNGFNKQQRKGIINYLIRSCPYAEKFSDTNGIYCSKKYNKRCERTGANLWIDYVQCPKDCPIHPTNLSITCDGAKCSEITKELKLLTQSIQEAGE